MKNIPEVLNGLANITYKSYDNLLWRRDALDIARTIASRALFVSLTQGTIQVEAWKQKKVDAANILQLAKLSQDLLVSLSEILSMSDDFSMYASLQKLYDVKAINGFPAMVNPHSEQTLKGNAENNYCRSHHYELVEHVYRPEMKVYWKWVLNQIKTGDRTEWEYPKEFTEQGRIIKDRFYRTSLAEMAPKKSRSAKNLANILMHLADQINKLSVEIQSK